MERFCSCKKSNREGSRHGDFERSQMRGVSINDEDDRENGDDDDDEDDDHGDILSRGMKGRAFGEGLIINCSSSCSNREIKSEGN